MSTEDRHRMASDLFARAVTLPQEQRQLFIESECGNDRELLADVQSLLAFDDGHSGFPESPLIGVSGGREADIDDDSMIGRTVGRYRIEGKLGRGGMGVVWKAADPLLDRHVALKLIPARLQASPSSRERFLCGARAASRLDHTGIATVYDAGDDGEDIYITMRLVDGPTLREYLKNGPLSPREAVRIGLAAAEALAYAHAHGVVHRDVTSNNIMIGSTGHVFVVDFGLALRPGAPRFSSGGRAVGTISYMAPELLAGEDGDERSDIFALGVVLYEIVTGKLPFVGRTQAGVIKEIVHSTPAPIATYRSDVSKNLERIILRALGKEPAARYQSAAELVTDLRAERRTIDPGAEHHARPRSLGWWAKRLAVSAMLLAAAVTTGLLLSRSARDKQAVPEFSVTTSSPEAYQHYIEGEAFRYKWDVTNANISYNRAVSCDSTFAMAYLRLTRWGSRAEKQAAIAKALEYADRATPRERGLIRARAARISGDTEGAITELNGLIEVFPDDKEAYIERSIVYASTAERKRIDDLKKALELDPLDKTALCYLAYAYRDVGELDSCLLIVNRYVEVAPDEVNPYDSRGELYATMGKLDAAIASYEKGMTIDPNFPSGLQWLGLLYIFTEQYEKAHQLYTRIVATGTQDQRGTGRLYLAFIPLYQGKLDEAADALEKGLAADEMEGYDGWAYRWKLYHRCSIHAEKKEWDRCLKRTRELIANLQERVPGHMGWHWAYIAFLARKGEFSAADAELDGLLRSVADTTDAEQMFDYWQSKALIERERGDFVAACNAMEHINRGLWDIWNRYEYALACLSAGRLPEAVEQLEAIVRAPHENKIFNVLRGARSIYYLGVVYEESGRPRDAVQQYKKFLSLWHDADPGIDGVADARARLAALGSYDS